MTLEVADWLPGVIVGVLPALPLDQVLRLTCRFTVQYNKLYPEQCTVH